MNTQIKIQFFLVLAFLLADYFPAKTQTMLIPGETINTRSASNTDRQIPDDAATITISLRGGDGGKADFKAPCNSLFKGGGGATVSVTYPVSDTGNGLEPGGLLRFYAGQHGENRDAECANVGSVCGGGGGSSAVLYLPPGESASGINWVVLAIAGGGSGAARANPLNRQVGKGGRDVTEGGSLSDDSNSYQGGDIGRCPDGYARAGNRNGLGGNIACDRTRDQDGACVANNYTYANGLLKVSLSGDPNSTGGDKGANNSPEGGAGFSGGGTAGFGSGGGGGVGGGACNENQAGGGGGSFVQSAYFGAYNDDITAGEDGGGNGDENHHGEVTISSTPVPYLARCQSNVTVELDENGEAPLQISQVDNNSILPNGGSLGLVLGIYLLPDDFSYACGSAGANNDINLVIFDADDTVLDYCTSSVSVVDILPPTALCQNLTIQLDENGTALLTAGSLDGGSWDNCSLAPFSFLDDTTQKTYDNCIEALTQGYTETLKVSDASGNTATCTSQITVEDNIPPVLVCKQNSTAALNADGQGQISIDDVLEERSDNCFLIEENFARLVDCNDVGPIQQTITLFDQSSNSASCTASITIVDHIAPTVLTKNITLQLDENGQASITGADIDAGSDDACGVQSRIVSPNTFACYDLGDNTVTLTVTDANGNEASETAVVTIEDSMTPVALCKNNSVVLNQNGEASISIATINNGSYDNCTTPGNQYALGINRNSFNCTHVGPQSVVLTITDHVGLTDQCTATVNVIDNSPPTLVCPQDKVVSTNTDECTFVVPFALDYGLTNVVPNIATEYGWYTDNCNSNPLRPLPIENDYNNSNNLDGASFPVGTTDVTWSVTDPGGNVVSCTFTVSVEDQQAPTLVTDCPILTIVTLDADPNLCGQIFTFDTPTFVDDCDAGLTIEQVGGFASGEAFPIGTTEFYFTAIDQSGNTNDAQNCRTRVTVNDVAPPVAECVESLTVSFVNDGSYPAVTIQPHQIDNGSFDVCGSIKQLYLTGNTYIDCDSPAENIVTLVAEDFSGNTGSCQTTVILDDEPPTAECQDITATLDADGAASIRARDVLTSEFSICHQFNFPNLSLDRSSFTCNDLGPQAVTLTMTDYKGRITTCQSTVTVRDDRAPSFSCNFIHTVELDVNGNASLSINDVVSNLNDACGLESLTMAQSSFGCSDVGQTTTSVTATDVNGNSRSCTVTVFVRDFIAPIARCQDATVQLDADGSASIAAADIDNGSSDVCGDVSLEVSPSSFDCSQLGMATATLTVTDESGNSSSCTASVIVEEGSPVAICTSELVDVELDENGQASITPEQLDGGSYVSCGDLFLSLNQTDFSCAIRGTQNVTLTASDGNGGSSSCQTRVRVRDNVRPTAICKDITAQLDETGQVSVDASLADNGSTDNCGVLRFLYDDFYSSSRTYDCSHIAIPVAEQLYVADGSDNFRICLARITIQDNVAPNAVCQDVTVQLDANGQGTISVNSVNNDSSDACGIANMALDNNTFDCAHLGNNNTVTLTVTDVNGNASSCQANVAVIDNTPPTMICKDVTVSFDDNGMARFDPDIIDDGSFDNCATESSVGSLGFAISCSEAGTTIPVTYTFNDGNGNLGECTRNVSLVDDTAPTALCQDITVELDASGVATATAADVNKGSSDNCGIANMVLDNNTFDCAHLGNNTVSLTVTDGSGNASSCEANVEVVDNRPPTMICKDVVVSFDNKGVAIFTTDIIDDGSFDNCVPSLSLAPIFLEVPCSEAGNAIPVTYTFIDGNGNVGECTRNVSVVDNTPPIALCQDIAATLDASGVASITAAEVDNGSSDNCGIASLDLNQTTFDCNDLANGASVVLTVGDGSGNESTCTATVSVVDPIAPTALCQDATVQLDDTGSGSLTAAQVDAGSSDDCGIASLALDKTDFSCADVGNNPTVVLTVTDASGNTATCSAALTVISPSDLSWQLAPGAKLWPPDYSYQTFTVSDMVSAISDLCGEAVALNEVWIDRASSDEVEDDPGTQDGNTLNDIVVSADCRSIQVRKERMGGGNGRVYTVTLAFRDAADNTSYADYKIQAPKWAWGWNSEAVEDGAVYTVSCGGTGHAAVISNDQKPSSTVLTRDVFQESNIRMEIYPNPFHSKTNLKIYLPEEASTMISVFNLQGQLVRQLNSRLMAAGEHRLAWDGTDASGQPLPPGMYLIQLQFGEEVVNKKVLLQRL